MTVHTGYRVHAAAQYSQGPSGRLRRGEATSKDGGMWCFGGLVVLVAVFISGASFAGQKLYDAKLSSPHSARAPGNDAPLVGSGDGNGTPSAPFAMSLSASGSPTTPTLTPTTAAAAAAQPATSTPATVASPVRVVRRNVAPRRAAGAISVAGGALPEGRGAVSAGTPTPPNWL